ARMEPGPLILRRFLSLAEHFARPGEVESASGRQVLHRREQVMGTVDVCVERREFVVERIADKALRGQMVTLVRVHLGDYLVDAGIALERGGVQGDLRPERVQAGEPVFGILKRNPADDTVD